MPALAADWCAGDSSSMTDTFTDSKPSKKNLYKLNGGGSSASDGHVLNGVRKVNGNVANGLGDDIPRPKVLLFDPKKLRLNWPKRLPAGAGLSNLGNTCFLNSVLQCLVYTPPLALHLVSDEHKMSCRVKEFCMLCSLQDHLNRSLRGNAAFKPLQILQNLRNIAKSLTWGQQEDAHEFLRYVVDAMQKSCLAGTNGLDKFSKETTFVYQVFSGYLRSQVKCLKCLHASNTYDPFLDLSLDIKDSLSVEQAMASFVSPEKLDIENAYKCEKCKVKVPAQKRFTIHRTSNVLTVHLKRFDMSRPLGCKVSRHIKFPAELNLRPYMSSTQGEPVVYVLYGVLVHSGFSCNSGHYYCYVRAPNSKWYCMNDSSVTLVSPHTVFGAEAYILFYVRNGQPSNHAGDKPHTVTRPENGSGDHRATRMIGPQLPHTSHAARPSTGPRPPPAALNKSVATSSAVKFPGVKSQIKVCGANVTPKVVVPSLVPYTEPGDSDEDDYEATDAPKVGNKEVNGFVPAQALDSVSAPPSMTFTPRSVLKPSLSVDSKSSTLNGKVDKQTLNGHTLKLSGAGDVSTTLPSRKHDIANGGLAQTSKIQTHDTSCAPQPETGEMEGQDCVKGVSSAPKTSENHNSIRLAESAQPSTSVYNSKHSNKLDSVPRNGEHSTSSSKLRHSRSPSVHLPSTHSDKTLTSNNAFNSQHKLAERSPNRLPHKRTRSPHGRRSSPRRFRRSRSSDRYSRSPHGRRRSQHTSRYSRSRSPRRSRSQVRSRSSRHTHRSRWTQLESPCWPRRSRSPRRSRYSQSPRRSWRPRSPGRSRCSPSPRRSRYSRSPYKSRRSRSPHALRRSRSPHISRRSRSPGALKKSQSMRTSRRDRSPYRSRRSRSLHKSRRSRSQSKPSSKSTRQNRTSRSASPCHRRADNINDSQWKSENVQHPLSNGNGVHVENAFYNHKYRKEIYTDSRESVRQHASSNDHSYSSKYTHSNGSHEHQLYKDADSHTKRKHKKKHRYKDEMKEPLLADSSDDYDWVEVTKGKESFKKGNKHNGVADSENSDDKKMSALTKLVHSKER